MKKIVILIMIILLLPVFAGCVVPPYYGGIHGSPHGSGGYHGRVIGAERHRIRQEEAWHQDSYRRQMNRFGPGGMNSRYGQDAFDPSLKF